MTYSRYFCLKYPLVLQYLKPHIWVFLLLVAACSSSLDDLPETPEKLVVQAEFSPGRPIELYVFQGLGLPYSGSNPLVPDTVALTVSLEGKNLEVSRLSEPFPRYVVSNPGHTPGEEYELRAFIPGEESIPAVKANSIIPYSDSLYQLAIGVDTTQVSGDNRIVKLTVSFRISAHNPERFYELAVLQEAEGRLMPPIDTLWTPVTGKTAFVVSDEHVLPAGIYWLNSRKSFLIDHSRLADKNIRLELEMKSTLVSDLSRLGSSLNRTLTTDSNSSVPTTKCSPTTMRSSRS
jgi:hypothetical protein